MAKYGSGRGGRPWRRKRDRVLARDNYLCQECLKAGRIEEAKEVDHVLSLANGGADTDDNLQSLCEPCHKLKSRIESRSGSNMAAAVPTFTRKPMIPVTVVCGPSGSGKTTYVRQNAKANDLVLDLDETISRLSGLDWYEAGKQWIQPALKERNARLSALAEPSVYGKAWLIVSAPTCSERKKWQEMLNAEVIVIKPSMETCLARVKGRHGTQWPSVIATWFDKWSSGFNETVIR